MHKVDFLVTTLDRYHYLRQLLNSIFKFYPNAKVTVADQSKKIDTDFYNEWKDRDLRVFPLPYDCGLSRARNILVGETKRPYKLILEDDFKFIQETKIENLVKLMDIADIAGGAVGTRHFRIPFEHYFEKTGDAIYQIPDGDHWKRYEGIDYKPTGCVMNFALFKDKVFDETIWDDRLKLREHQHFFYRCKNPIVFTDNVEIRDNKKGNTKEYKALKGRDDFWKIALEDLGVTKFVYLNGQAVELEGDKIYRYKIKK